MAIMPRLLRWPRHPLWRVAALAAIVAFVLGSAALGFLAGRRQGVASVRADSNHRLDLFSSVAQGVIRRLEYVPATIQLNRDVLALLNEPDAPARRQSANDYLRRLNAHLGSVSVFVLNDRGIVLASSNTEHADDSRLGEDIAFRPYFLDALSGRVGHHFAIGVDGDEPGYFVSHPIHDGARVVGVAAIKIGLQAIDKTWPMLGAHALLADTNQIVILSSEPDWLYTSLVDLSPERRVDLQLTRLYNDRRIRRFPLPVPAQLFDDSKNDGALDASSVMQDSGDAGLLIQVRTLDGMDWRLIMFSDLHAVHQQAVMAASASGMAAAIVVLLGFAVAQRRRIQRQRLQSKLQLQEANAALERKVLSRTRDLTDANERLRREVIERERAEQTLREAQGELVQTTKMATLGQLATGITHELTQPLGAIRTLAGNAAQFLKRGDLKALDGNLSIIARLADQMGSIIQPLKGFARKSQPMPERCDVAQVVGNALFLYQTRLRESGVEVVNECRPGRAIAWCDANRLEQVLINLVGNAIDAMAGASVRRLTLRAVYADADSGPARRVRVEVLDTGSGFSDEALAHLFDPFFTTKPPGAGLGLGLAISRDIVREFDGDIEAARRPEGGARFAVHLRAALEEETSDR